MHLLIVFVEAPTPYKSWHLKFLSFHHHHHAPHPKDDLCVTNSACARTYVSEYIHVGGYYGACNEETMLEDLVTTGPLSVSFEVYDDFRSYESGIYHHTGVRGDFNPFEVSAYAGNIILGNLI